MTPKQFSALERLSAEWPRWESAAALNRSASVLGSLAAVGWARSARQSDHPHGAIGAAVYYQLYQITDAGRAALRIRSSQAGSDGGDRGE